MASILDKIKQSAKPAQSIVPDPMSNQEVSQVVESIPEEIKMQSVEMTDEIPSPEMSQEYSDFEDSDIESIVNMWPLWAIYEYVEPLVLASTPEQVLEFFHKITMSRIEAVNSL